MANEFFKYDPVTGVTTFFDFDEDKGEAILTKHQDVRSVLDYAAEVRNSRVTEDEIKKDDYGIHYAVIPAIVEMELMKKGINIHDPNCTKRLLQELNSNYPWLKLTDKKHVASV